WYSRPCCRLVACCRPSIACSPFFCVLLQPRTTGIYTLSLHDALPICRLDPHSQLVRTGLVEFDLCDGDWPRLRVGARSLHFGERSEEHTSELQSRENLVCRLLLEKKEPAQDNTAAVVASAPRAVYKAG